MGSAERGKALEVVAGTERTYELAKKYKIKTAFGTDVLFSREMAQQQGQLLVSLVRWFTPGETLERVCGTSEIDPAPYVRYLREKLAAIYGIATTA